MYKEDKLHVLEVKLFGKIRDVLELMDTSTISYVMITLSLTVWS